MVRLIKKIEKEIQKYERIKQVKSEKRKELDEELSDVNTKLKELYTLKNQFDKLLHGAEEFINNL